jgi:hypothetical protein
MKKNKTTKSTKKSYSSVKEILEDNNSNIKLTPLNCKEAKFGKIIEIDNPYSSTGKFDFIFRRASTSEKFFDGIENQRSNQILWNEEEQQAYFINPDKKLYKILFEPITMKKKTLNQTYEEYTEELNKKAYLEKEIEKLAIPWSKFYDENARWYNEQYKLSLLTSMFINLLDLVREKTIKVKCGICMMDIIERYSHYNPYSPNKSIHVGSCEIIPELDFNLGQFDLAYDNITLVGQGVHDMTDCRWVPNKVLQKQNEIKKSFWSNFKPWN